MLSESILIGKKWSKDDEDWFTVSDQELMDLSTNYDDHIVQSISFNERWFGLFNITLER